MKSYYLDSAAHVPMNLSAQKAYIDYQNSEISYGHPSSVNLIGKKASSAVEVARNEIAELLGCNSKQLIFTNTCTEACNWAVEIILNKANGNIINYSPFEHPAIKYLLESKNNIRKINLVNGKVDEFGEDYNICLHVQNEIGLIQPIDKFSKYLLCDMSQSLGKVKIDLKSMNVDLATFSGHKVGAGSIGILYVKNIEDLVSFGYGSRYYLDRVGSPDVAGIVALSAGLKETMEKMSEKQNKARQFQESLEKKLKSNGLNVIYG